MVFFPMRSVSKENLETNFCMTVKHKIQVARTIHNQSILRANKGVLQGIESKKKKIINTFLNKVHKEKINDNKGYLNYRNH